MQNEARQRLLQLQQGLQTEVSSSELMEGDRGGERGKSTGQQQLLVLHADPRWLAGNRSWKSFITGKSSKPSKDGLKKILKLLMTALKTTVKQGRVSEGSSDTRHRFGLGSVAMQPYPRGKHSVSLEVCSILREIERERHTPTASIFLTSVTISFLELPRQVMHRFSYSSPCMIGIKAA